ncbi:MULTISPECIES: hypothetical protein [unclassified Streptomyces]|nr:MULTISPECIES: hypothetical protein [unclassified Streptomyces]
MTARRTAQVGVADVVAVRRDCAASTGRNTVVRLLGLLPGDWAGRTGW